MHPPSSKPRSSHTRLPPLLPNGLLPRINCVHFLTPLLTLPARAIVKTALPDDETASKNLARECQSYRLPGVVSAACFRKMYDIIDNRTIALEWLDTTLADVKYQPDLRTYALIKTVLKEALTSCDILDAQQHVNTGTVFHLEGLASGLTSLDYKPANILLSGVETGRIVARVGDLGLGKLAAFLDETDSFTDILIVVPVGYLFHAQPYAMRAPEVFLGQACTEQSQVWAVAAMLLSGSSLVSWV